MLSIVSLFWESSNICVASVDRTVNHIAISSASVHRRDSHACRGFRLWAGGGSGECAHAPPHRERPHEKTRRRETLRRVICECCSLARYAFGVVGNGLQTLPDAEASQGGIAPHLLLEKGVDLATVSERLGHSSVRTTADIYSHAIRGKGQAAAQVWDDIKEQARTEKPAGVFLLT